MIRFSPTQKGDKAVRSKTQMSYFVTINEIFIKN